MAHATGGEPHPDDLPEDMPASEPADDDEAALEHAETIADDDRDDRLPEDDGDPRLS